MKINISFYYYQIKYVPVLVNSNKHFMIIFIVHKYHLISTLNLINQEV